MDKKKVESVQVRKKIGDFLFVKTHKLSGEKDISHLAIIYNNSFDATSSSTPCIQAYSKEGIIAVLKDLEIIKYIIYFDGLAVGFALGTTNLRKVPWINLEFYKKNFPSHVEKNTLFYIKGVVIAPEFQNRSIKIEKDGTITLGAAIFNFVVSTFPVDSVLAFDCSEKTNFWLCDAIMSSTACLETPNANQGKTFIDRQLYHVLHKTVETKKFIKE